MRRVSKSAYQPNTDAAFARGVERLIAQKSAQPTGYPDFELDAILRKEQAAERHQAVANQPDPAPVFDDFLRLLAWKNVQRRF